MDTKGSPLPIPVLPEDLELLCLMHVPWQSQGSLLLVCKRWCQLVVSGGLARARQAANKTEELLAVRFHAYRPQSCVTRGLVFQAFNPSYCGLGPSSRALPRVYYQARMQGPVLVSSQNSTGAGGDLRVAKYDSVENAWLSYDVKDHSGPAGAAMLSDGRIVLVGGGDRKHVSRKVTVVSASMTSQERLPEINTGRWFCSVSEVKGDLWVMGGYVSVSMNDIADSPEVLPKDGKTWNMQPGSVRNTAREHYATNGARILVASPVQKSPPTVMLLEYDCIMTVTLARGRYVQLVANGDCYFHQCWPDFINQKLHLLALWNDKREQACKMVTLELPMEHWQKVQGVGRSERVMQCDTASAPESDHLSCDGLFVFRA